MTNHNVQRYLEVKNTTMKSLISSYFKFICYTALSSECSDALVNHCWNNLINKTLNISTPFQLVKCTDRKWRE